METEQDGLTVIPGFEEHPNVSYEECLARRNRLADLLSKSPHSLPLQTQLAIVDIHLQYPDLAAGVAYKCLLLADAIQDESDEFHDEAFRAMEVWLDEMDRSPQEAGADLEATVRDYFTPLVYRILIQSLLTVGCYKSAMAFSTQASKLGIQSGQLDSLRTDVRSAVAQHYNVSVGMLDSSSHTDPSEWPDTGLVRREQYPWNTHEPDRFAELDNLNAMMSDVAPRLAVRAVELPDLTGNTEGISKQLGVFAKEDIAPGEIVLDETSVLTANNKLQDALCDACSADLPGLATPEAEMTVACPECEVVFCSQRCYDLAMQSYHPALCGADIDSIAKDVPPAQAADALYALLLLRAFAMAQTQQFHPLELQEVKYIWADFHTQPLPQAWQLSTLSNPVPSKLPQTLPFSFETHIRLPMHMLEKMDLNPFTTPLSQTWIINTLYAKFRGTASARLSGLGGRAARGPEVSAVHPMWCLANHTCDPNVSWEWGGSVRFWVRGGRVGWIREGKKEKGQVRNEPGLRKGEEVLNHYCDVELPVKERREWARGALGGDCMCERCRWEAGET